MPFPLLLAAIAGLAHAVSIAPPWGGQPQGWLQLLALGLLAWLLGRCTTARQGGLLGWTFALAWLSGTFWWLFVAMHTYGGLAAPLAVLAILLLAGVLALYYAGVSACFVAVAPVNQAWSAILFASLWMLAEMARGIWFTGFGWGGSGYAHVDGLAGAASYVGVYGVGALAGFTAYVLMAWLTRPLGAGSWRLAALLVPVALVPVFGGGGFSTAAPTLSVALLQGNIPQDEKFQPGSGVADALRWYGDQLQVNQASLVVAPETAIPVLISQLPPGYWDAVARSFTQGRQAALIGIPLGTPAQGYTNAVLGLKPAPAKSAASATRGVESANGEAVYRYDKHHLVPFGEFIPPLFRWFTEMMNIPLGDFNRGDVGQASFEWQGQRLAPNVCYEDLFGEVLGQRFIDPDQAPTVFVNVSNIGWFGNTVAIDQHLQISRMRALEFERPMIRATNTGATVIIDHTGRVTHSLPRHTRGVLTGEVQGRHGITPYAWWVSRLGLWPLWILGAAVVLLAFVARRRALSTSPLPVPGQLHPTSVKGGNHDAP